MSLKREQMSKMTSVSLWKRLRDGKANSENIVIIAYSLKGYQFVLGGILGGLIYVLLVSPSTSRSLLSFLHR